MVLSILGFKLSNRWNGILNNTYISIIKIPYNEAEVKLLYLSLLWSIKYDTVKGIMGNIQGVNKAKNPARKPKMKISKKLDDWIISKLS